MEELLTRAEADALGIGRHALAVRIARDDWHRVMRDVYATEGVDPDEPAVRHRAALKYVGGSVALSGPCALFEHGIDIGHELRPTHVRVLDRRDIDETSDLVAHRPLRNIDAALTTVNSLVVERVELALITSWQILTKNPGRRRSAAWRVLTDRRTTAERCRAQVDARPTLPGRRELLQLISLVDAGCHSELEMHFWCDVVPLLGLELRPQVRVRLRSGNAYLDAADEELMLAVELDGGQHFDAAAAVADRRRDAELAALGWLVLRFTWAQVIHQPEWVVSVIRAAAMQRRLPLIGRR